MCERSEISSTNSAPYEGSAAETGARPDLALKLWCWPLRSSPRKLERATRDHRFKVIVRLRSNFRAPPSNHSQARSIQSAAIVSCPEMPAGLGSSLARSHTISPSGRRPPEAPASSSAALFPGLVLSGRHPAAQGSSSARCALMYLMCISMFADCKISGKQADS